MTVYYEVNLSIEADTYAAYKEWLLAHVEEIIKFKGFQAYEICEAGASEGRVELSVRYTVATMEDLEEYFSKHAPKMREEGLRLFANKFTATRRVLRPLKKSE